MDGIFHFWTDFWRMPSRSPRASSPSTSDVHAIDGDSKITAIYDIRSPNGPKPAVVLSQVPKAVVVFSEHNNRRGIYTRAPAAYEGFPVYTDAVSGLSLWHDLGGRWVCSSGAGSNVRKAWPVKSCEHSPDLIPPKELDAFG